MSATSPSTLDFSFVIPAFNEASRLSDGLRRLDHAIQTGMLDPERSEFLVVDDGSTDSTAQRAGELFSPYPNVAVIQLDRNLGKGAAVRAGVRVARGEVIAFSDADMAVDPIQIPLMLEALEHSDIAIGCRTLPGSAADGDTFKRNLMGRTFNGIVQLATHLSFSDTQCGFKAFRAPIAKLLFGCSSIDGFAFDVDLLSIAQRFGLRVAEVPVQWQHVQGSGIRIVADPLSMVKDVLRSRAGMRSTTLDCVLLDISIEKWPLVSSTTLGFVGSAPILKSGDQEILVLFPLADAKASTEFITRMETTLPEISARRSKVGDVDMRRLSPLELLNDPPHWILNK